MQVSLVQQAYTWFDERRFVERLMRLSSIDSGTRDTVGINTKVDLYQEWLRSLGFETRLFPSTEYGNNLAAVGEGEGNIALALIGHVDTVYPVGSVSQHPPRIEKDQLYGLGTSDMHGGNLLLTEALRFLVERNLKPYGKVLVVLNNDEEWASMHSRPWIQRLLLEHAIHVGLEFESQEEWIRGINVTVGRRSQSAYHLTVRGKEGHAGLGEGISAVDALLFKLLRLRELVAQYEGMSINITGLFGGGDGTRYTTRAGDAGATVSFRATSPQEYFKIGELLNRIVANEKPEKQGSEVTITPFNHTPPPYLPTPQISHLAELGRSVAEELNLPFTTGLKGSTSDANAFAEVGIPVLASLGPMGGGEHNATEEHILLGDPLREKFAFVVGLIDRVCAFR